MPKMLLCDDAVETDQGYVCEGRDQKWQGVKLSVVVVVVGWMRRRLDKRRGRKVKGGGGQAAQ